MKNNFSLIFLCLLFSCSNTKLPENYTAYLSEEYLINLNNKKSHIDARNECTYEDAIEINQGYLFKSDLGNESYIVDELKSIKNYQFLKDKIIDDKNHVYRKVENSISDTICSVIFGKDIYIYKNNSIKYTKGKIIFNGHKFDLNTTTNFNNLEMDIISNEKENYAIRVVSEGIKLFRVEKDFYGFKENVDFIGLFKKK